MIHYIPGIVEDIDNTWFPRYHGIFNQIKQEYVSARFRGFMKD